MTVPQRKWISAVTKTDELGRAAKLVGVTVASLGDPDGTNARPGTDVLVNRTDYSKRTVHRAVVELRERGWLRRVRRGSQHGRRGIADEYELVMPGRGTGARTGATHDTRSRPEQVPEQVPSMPSEQVPLVAPLHKEDQGGAVAVAPPPPPEGRQPEFPTRPPAGPDDPGRLEAMELARAIGDRAKAGGVRRRGGRGRDR